MSKVFELKTQNFPIVDYPDGDHFNGKEISNRLREHLTARDYVVRDIVEEDWGWWIGIKDSNNICVYCLEDYELMIHGKETKFSWKKLKREKSERFEKLKSDLLEIIDIDPDMELIALKDEI